MLNMPVLDVPVMGVGMLASVPAVTDPVPTQPCGPIDVMCHLQEGLTSGLSQLLSYLMTVLLSGREFNPSTTLWSAAEDQASFWAGYVVMIMLITAVIGLTVGLLRGDPHAIRRVLIGTVLSIPSSLFALFVLGKALEVVDAISQGMLDNFGGSDGLRNFVNNMVGPGSIAAAGGVQANAFVVNLLMLMAVIAMFMLMLALAFRNFALLLLVAFAPLAFMILPVRGGEVWVKRWVGAVVAMMLAKPVMFGSLQLLFHAFGQTSTDILDPANLTLIVGLFATAFMPMMIYGFFQFLGADQAASHIGSQAASRGSAALRQGSAVAGRGVGALKGAAGKGGSSGAKGAPGGGFGNGTGGGAGGGAGAGGAPAMPKPSAGGSSGMRPGAGAGSASTFTPPK